MNNLVEYTKEAKKAFKTYINSDESNYDLCEKIYEYIQKIENLNSDEKNELDSFINENTFSIVANIYTDKNRKKTLKKQLIRMTPFNLAKPDSRIYRANGDFSQFISSKNKQSIKIKTYPKKMA